MNPLRTPWQRKWFALEVTAPGVQGLADAAMSFCGRWVEQSNLNRLFYLFGPSGTAKTHVARAIYRYCRAAQMEAFRNMPRSRTTLPAVLYVHWPSVANEFREKNLSALPDLFAADCLVVDDFGAEDDPFKVVADKVCQVLSRRAGKFTVITSNKAPEEFADVDPRIGDRLFRDAEHFDLKGVPSYAEWVRLRVAPAGH